ncbi:MAG TPA: DUF4268 domain-containing protein [Candidatus Nealsonbacteria bacterium]|uniref:DUF4268 domain-containing protein n=1 Tax=marine sediment metagenome TaxID=412755 RepID=A0A0F9YE45_9ZZZZ|nr:DUF4268 domain-containing protein [Candidatus Nealsonbacteria bacterium]HEB46305.1 DUF4268 domain-containing protein [Candidatus Nealsonbacteria bacterium]
MKKHIERIKKVPLREVWKNEARDFTSWLFDNIEILGEELDMDLTAIDREGDAGSFSVDIIAEDENGQKVVIENQLEKTNHEHLGKILTYLANLDAKIAIWISSNPRQEHERAIDWLNEFGPETAFYLVQIEAYKIGNSNPAAKFSIIAGPSEGSETIGKKKKEYAKRHILRKEFWTALLEKAKGKTSLHSNITPGIYSWIGTGAGKQGIIYSYVITKKYGGCEIYFDKGKDYIKPNINKIRFDKLYKHKNQIEKKFKGRLNWERLDNARASRISIKFKGKGLNDKENWEKLQDKMIDAMIRLERAFKEYIRRLG